MLELDSWRRTSPLAVLSFFGRGIKALAGNYAQLAGTAGMLIILARESLLAAVLGGAALLVLLVVVAGLSFWRFRFKLAPDRVLIRQGVLRHRELAVQFNRIQGVHLEQSLLFRLAGLATVSFDTAGSAQREGELPAVPAAFAAALRDQIDSRRAGATPVSADAAPAEQRPLVKLGNRDLVRIGLTDPSVLTGLLFVPLLVQNDAFRDATLDALTQSANAVQGHLALAIAVVLAALGALLLAATMASAFLRFHGFELRLQGTVLRARGGLLTRKETVLERHKIQQFALSQSLPLRWIRRYRLRAVAAISGLVRDRSSGQMQAGAALTVPLADAAAMANLREQMFGGEAGALSQLPSDGFAPISALWLRRQMLMTGVLPVAAAGLPALLIAQEEDIHLGWLGAACLAWVLAAAPLLWLAWRKRGYAYNLEALAIRSGCLGWRVETSLFRKIQAVAVRRSPLQRRHGLATLEVQLASGGARVPFIPHATACALRDMMLYKAESSRRPWH